MIEKEEPYGKEIEFNSPFFRGGRVQASLGCATDHEWEGNKESKGMIIAELHNSEIWTLRRPHPAAWQDAQWRFKDTNRTNNLPIQSVSCLQEI